MANDSKSPKGFAGLDDMASDVQVDATHPQPTTPLRPSTQATQAAVDTQPHSNPIPRRSEAAESSQLPPKPSGLSSGWIWVICIGCVIILANVFGGKSNPNTYTPSASSYTPTPTYTPPPVYQAPEPAYTPPPVYQAPEPAYTPPPVYQAPELAYTPPSTVYEPPAPAKTYESQPMPGIDNVLEDSELRYCISQKIRIQGWEPNVNTSSQTSVDAFNWAISDFNSRCASYRYKTQVMDRVRSEVNSRSTDLLFEGVNLATQNP